MQKFNFFCLFFFEGFPKSQEKTWTMQSKMFLECNLLKVCTSVITKHNICSPIKVFTTKIPLVFMIGNLCCPNIPLSKRVIKYIIFAWAGIVLPLISLQIPENGHWNRILVEALEIDFSYCSHPVWKFCFCSTSVWIYIMRFEMCFGCMVSLA